MATRGTGHSPANVTKHLKGIDFPAEKQDLLKHAQHMKAEKVVLDEIQKMEDREYGNMADVMKSFRKERGVEESGGQSGKSGRAKQQTGGQAGQGKSHSRAHH
ncbi:DUF2795 domain-containing protein [Geomonas paludis]|uniref:DUF2795 domain-containing protein n=1 Tax=Geomonas paludis TaxID=2740185 RepID=A0A6V8MUB8_9BACT|nr:DUF2795 domain-containing protein [Geomonas paludis]UPU37686.1 DUF2795 domain-containing protein [Geomonas paludis]GFO63778.1 hypothetical protein GMPD_16970 [Geomonas paludis]